MSMMRKHIRALLFVLAAMLPVLANAQSFTGPYNTCWKDSYTRGVATVPSCAPGSQNSAGLCYPGCNPGYVGVGFLCWQSCPQGWQDIGVSCTKPNTITRPTFLPQQVSYAIQTGTPSGLSCSGVTFPRGYLNPSTGALREGYDPIPSSGPNAMQSGEIAVNLGAPFYDGRLDSPNTGAQCWVCPSGYSRGTDKVTANDACYVDNGSTSNPLCTQWSSANGGPGICDEIGGLLYPRLASNYSCNNSVSCTIACPSGYTDNGLYCGKTQNYTRPVSSIPQTCQSGYGYDAGLCYPSCKAGFSGVGPVCWATCQAGTNYPVDCAAACAQDTPSCAVDITDQVLATLDVIANVIETFGTGGASEALSPLRDAMQDAIISGVKPVVKKIAGKITKDVIVAKVKEMSIETGKTIAESTPDIVGDLLTNQNYQFDWTVFDPTGISGLVNAFMRPLCSKVQGAATPQGKWVQLSGFASQVAVGHNGAIWAIGVDPVQGGYDIFHYVNNAWQKVAGGGVRIAVDPNGNPWVLSSSNQIYQWTGSGWKQMPGAASDIAIGDNGQVWVVSTQKASGGYQLDYWNAQTSSWVLGSGAGVHIAVQANGNPLALDSSGNIYAYSGSGWNQLPGAGAQIADGGGNFYALGNNQQTGGFPIYIWNGTMWNGMTGALYQIAVQPDGTPIGVNIAHNIFQFQKSQ